MKGWKTWAGAGITALGAGLNYLGYAELGDLVVKFGFALITIGVGHKIEKAMR